MWWILNLMSFMKSLVETYMTLKLLMVGCRLILKWEFKKGLISLELTGREYSALIFMCLKNHWFKVCKKQITDQEILIIKKNSDTKNNYKIFTTLIDHNSEDLISLIKKMKIIGISRLSTLKFKWIHKELLRHLNILHKKVLKM